MTLWTRRPTYTRGHIQPSSHPIQFNTHTPYFASPHRCLFFYFHFFGVLSYHRYDPWFFYSFVLCRIIHSSLHAVRRLFMHLLMTLGPPPVLPFAPCLSFQSVCPSFTASIPKRDTPHCYFIPYLLRYSRHLPSCSICSTTLFIASPIPPPPAHYPHYPVRNC